MPKFLTIGYGDASGYARLTPAVRDEAHANDDKLKRGGALMGIAGAPVQVRNPGGRGVATDSGAFMTSAMPVAGFAVIEADDLADAIALVAKSPCAVADGVIEVWPIEGA